MTQPTTVFFGLDGGSGSGDPKIFMRTLLYCTAKNGRIIENMFTKLRRGESVQNFNIWVYGDGPLARGSGLYVGEQGVACNHHFLLPKDGTKYEFLAGDYLIEVYVTLVGSKSPKMISRFSLSISEDKAKQLREMNKGIYFDWGPDSQKYTSHIDEKPQLRLEEKDAKLMETLKEVLTRGYS